MQLGMIGLGRMGSGMVQRLQRAGRECVVFDRDQATVQALTGTGVVGTSDLDEFNGRVSDSGEGRWTSIAAIESGTPARVLTTALYERFTSRDESDFADKVLSARRYGFGGHHEKWPVAAW